MRKISVAVVGFGNIGRACKRAVDESSDLILAGVVRRPATVGDDEPELKGVPVKVDVRQLKHVDVALLCSPASVLPEKVIEYQKYGLCTVDPFDEATSFWTYRKQAALSAEINKTVSIVGAGYDPGTNSAIRSLMRLPSITGHTTTTYGGKKGSRSMGATACVKAIAGVANAVALIFAEGRGMHKHKVYVELKSGADKTAVAERIKKIPYFKTDPVEVSFVRDIDKYNTFFQSICIERTGMQAAQKYILEGITPEFTANIMVSCARACMIAKEQEQYGAYSFIERPLTDYLPGTLEEKLTDYLV